MQEFSHVSKHSAADLVAALNDSAASGWSVLSVTHSAADGFVAILAREAGAAATTPAATTTATTVAATTPVAEPAGWAAAPQPAAVVQPTPVAQPQPAAVQPAAQVAATAAAANIPANWYADPSGRFELRYWDGQKWTEHVARGGQQFTDPATR